MTFLFVRSSQWKQSKTNDRNFLRRKGIFPSGICVSKKLPDELCLTCLYPKESTYRIISLKLNKFSWMNLRVYTALWAEDEMLTFDGGTTVLKELFHNLLYYHVPHGANNHECNRSPEYLRRITYNKSDNYNGVNINSIYSNRGDRNLWNARKDSRRYVSSTARLRVSRK